MTWTILVLLLGIALYVFSGKLVKQNAKKASAGAYYAKKAVNVVAALLMAGAVCRLVTPVYLVDVNPIIIQEMVESMQEKQQAEKNKLVRKYVREHSDEMSADAPILGNESAENTIYVWTAASCGYCRRVHGELERVLAERDDVRVVIKNFSIHGVMSDAPARAMIAAKLQGNDKAAKLVDMIMTREYRPQGKTDDQAKLASEIEKNIMKFAKEAGLDTEKLAQDMKGEVVARELANVRELAQQFEISGTPFLIVNEQAFPGAIPASQINAALDK
ncbi:MAG: thioredoxin domain-containing protein [Alphaproteobacteria bacterium]|nr:thioredoxin domain-containing protein [Alphaproteobacteria bacterium]